MKKALRRFQSQLLFRIWQQIFFMLVLLVVIPLFFLGLLMINTSQNAIKTSVLRDYELLASHTVGEVREHVEGARQQLRLTASILGVLHSNTWRQETTIVELSLQNAAFLHIAAVNRDGMETAISEIGEPLGNRSGDAAFQRAIQGESYLSDVQISGNHLPYITMAEPLKSLGKIQGALLAKVSLRSVWSVVDSLRFGETGHAYLIDHEGHIIAHSDKKMVFRNAEPFNAEIVRDVRQGKVGSREALGSDGNMWLVSFAPIHSLGWGLIIQQTQSEALAFSEQMIRQSWLLISLSIIAAIAVSYILSRCMSRPISELLQGTERLASGDFDHVFPVRRRNEMGRLLYSLNKMRRRLKNAKQSEQYSIIGKTSAAIAHELKNSLLLVRTLIKMLPQNYNDPAFLEEFSKTIPRELDAWNTSLQNMMSLVPDQNLVLEKTELNALLREIVKTAETKAVDKKVRLQARLCDMPLIIEASREKLKQALLNIVYNAIEASPSQGQVNVVSGKETFKHPCAVIDVENAGQPISKADLRRIFEPFYSTKTYGLGLGLSISREVIQQHKGTINVNTASSTKTVFTIRLPICPADSLGEPYEWLTDET